MTSSNIYGRVFPNCMICTQTAYRSPLKENTTFIYMFEYIKCIKYPYAAAEHCQGLIYSSLYLCVDASNLHAVQKRQNRPK